jgi:putative hemolysin
MTRTLLLLGTTTVVALLTAGATAVRSVNRLWLRSWIERDDDSDDSPMQRFVDRPKRLLMSAGTGVALTVFMAGAALALLDRQDPLALARDAALLAACVVVLGQLLPRAIARRWASQLVPVFVPMLRVIAVLVAPLRSLARRVALLLARRIAPRTTAQATADDSQATEGITELLQDGSLDGLDAREELAIISGVVQLSGKTAADVMTPRSEIFALDEALSPDEMARQIARAGFSRVPVFRGTLDQPVGMLHAFDVFVEAGSARPALRPVSEASLSQPAGELLYALLRARRQLAIVRSGDGTVAGLVTLEDLLEELVGEIADEHDEPASGSEGDA